MIRTLTRRDETQGTWALASPVPLGPLALLMVMLLLLLLR